MMISVFDKVENIVGKEENAGYQHFLLFLRCFQKSSHTGLQKVVIAWYRVKTVFAMTWLRIMIVMCP